ncbi:hypothetical protein [Herbiconiux solani]|uniref:hypothetical protein n=1 Tax=Herbiconiux solani TaxID=661329 RepID=UPI000826AB3B|nr:hypothetical protein [Herbiconiux solani]
MTGDDDLGTETPDEQAQAQAQLRSRIAILETLIAVRPLMPELLRDAAACRTPDEFATLIASRLDVSFSIAKANTRPETLATGFALTRLTAELAELRRLEPPPPDQAGGGPGVSSGVSPGPDKK